MTRLGGRSVIFSYIYLEKEKLEAVKLQDSLLKTMTGTTVGPAVRIIK